MLKLGRILGQATKGGNAWGGSGNSSQQIRGFVNNSDLSAAEQELSNGIVDRILSNDVIATELNRILEDFGVSTDASGMLPVTDTSFIDGLDDDEDEALLGSGGLRHDTTHAKGRRNRGARTKAQWKGLNGVMELNRLRTASKNRGVEAVEERLPLFVNADPHFSVRNVATERSLRSLQSSAKPVRLLECSVGTPAFLPTSEGGLWVRLWRRAVNLVKSAYKHCCNGMQLLWRCTARNFLANVCMFVVAAAALVSVFGDKLGPIWRCLQPMFQDFAKTCLVAQPQQSKE